MSENWIVPCSVKFFDVVNHFEENNTIVWRKVSALKKGDTAYIYIGAPYSEIKYKCHIIDDDVDEKTLQSNEYAIRKTMMVNYLWISCAKMVWDKHKSRHGQIEGFKHLFLMWMKGLEYRIIAFV